MQELTICQVVDHQHLSFNTLFMLVGPQNKCDLHAYQLCSHTLFPIWCVCECQRH